MPGTQSIEGLASSLDISGIVDTMMSYERIPVTYLEQDKEYKTQQVAAYQAVQAKFLSLKSSVLMLRKESTYHQANISISDDTIVSATSSGNVIEGSYNLQVLSLANNHQIASQGFSDATTEVFGTGTITLSLGDDSPKIITIDSGENSLMGIKDAINEASVGISASIINDGSSSNPYRLLLTGRDVGATNSINFSSVLSGGESLNYDTASFDSPETINFDSTSTAQVSLGSTALYTGDSNKIYTFTVAGDGEQTIGTDTITLDWSDGTNTGSIVVSQADAEVELFGDGSDGLKVSFGGGTLNAGDTFQVTTFAPLLQRASDAKVSIGAAGGGGSGIVVSSETNTFDEVLPSLSITVNKVTEANETVSISSKTDTIEIKNIIDDFISKYNDLMEFVNGQFEYNQDTTESGVLFSEYTLQVLQSTTRSATTSIIPGLDSTLNSLSAIGIRSDYDGKLTMTSSSDLTNAINNDIDSFIKLFTDSGNSSTPYIEFIDASEETVESDSYDVDITHAATKGYFQGKKITSPETSGITIDSNHNTLKLKVDGLVSDEIKLTERTYSSGEDLANEIQTRIDNDSKLKGHDVVAEWVSLGGDEGYLKLISGSYGSNSKVEMVTSITNSALGTLGLAGGAVFDGDDVAGTINGEKATGKGQVLTGDDGNETTDGLSLKVTFLSSQLSEGVDGTVSYVTGLASRMNETLNDITRSENGTIERRVSSLNAQITELDEQIADYEAKLARRREDLYSEFLEMEAALGEYQSESSYLEQQLASLNTNWGSSGSSSSD